MRKTCINCVNDQTVKNIKFNQEGLCNYCETYEKEFIKWHDFSQLKTIFDQRLENVKGKHRYDVCIPFSGGKDSTYVLYKMVTDYDLKIKAFTLDNGFLSPEAKKKIDLIVHTLNVEHEYLTLDVDFAKEIYHYIVGKYLSPCIACSYLGYAMMINYTSKIDAGLCLHGRSRPQMFRYYASDVDDTFKPLIESGLKDPQMIDYASLYGNILGQVNKYIDPKLAQKMNDVLLADVQNNGFREFVGYFLYHDYQLNDVIKTITTHLPWKVEKEVEHFDCLIHNGAKYLKDLIARRPHNMPEISFLVRDKKISRQEAQDILQKDITPYPDQELTLMCKYMNLNKKALLLKAKIYAKRWW